MKYPETPSEAVINICVGIKDNLHLETSTASNIKLIR